jgi:phage terminase large subunit
MILYEPSYLPRQEEALSYLSNDSSVEQVLYGGAAGGGKTKLGCLWQVQRRLKYAGTRSLIGRAKLDTLKKTTLKTLLEVMNELHLVQGKHYKLNLQNNTVKFYNDSEILLVDCFAYPRDPDFTDFSGLELTDYFLDEANELTKRAVDIISSRVRFKLNEYGLTPKGLLSCNPSRGWLYNEFYIPSTRNELPEHRAFVQSLPQDNPFLPESYLALLQRLPSYDRKRLLEGNWEFDDEADKLFHTDDLLRCFRDEVIDAGTKYITVDVARFGKDRTVVTVWNGLTMTALNEYRRLSITEVTDVVRSTMKEHNVLLTNVIADEDGVGGGLVDVTKCRGFRNGSRARNSETFTNLKAECYFKLAEVIEQSRLTFLVNSHKDNIVKELTTIKRHKPDGDNKLMVTPKEQIKAITGFSPDIADAIMMRMFFELYPNFGQYFIGRR